jgi:hypothetical protein
VEVSTMSGHTKWSEIKRRKGAPTEPWIRRRGGLHGSWHYQADPEPAGVPVRTVAGILGACGSNVGSDDELDRAPTVAEGQRCPACQRIVLRRVTEGRD